jgi:hypothetical protein
LRTFEVAGGVVAAGHQLATNAFSASIEQVVFTNAERPNEVAMHLDKPTGGEELCRPPPPAATIASHQIVSGGNAASNRVNHVVDYQERKPMPVQGGVGHLYDIRADPVPPTGGDRHQGRFASAMAAHGDALRNAGSRSTGFSLSDTLPVEGNGTVDAVWTGENSIIAGSGANFSAFSAGLDLSLRRERSGLLALARAFRSSTLATTAARWAMMLATLAAA